MSAATAAAPLAPARRAATVRPVTFGRLVASEWIKLRSLRSTWWSLGVAAAFLVAFAVLQTWGTSTDPLNFGSGVSQSGASFVTGGWFLVQLVVCVLGALLITGEYGTGQIRSTLSAEPRRIPVLAAKLVVLFGTVFAAMTVAAAIGWAGASPWFDTIGVSIDLTDPSDLRVLLGTPLYLATVAALAFAFGALLRNSAAAIATVLGLLLVVENVFSLIPGRFIELAGPFLPSRAGSLVLQDDSSLDAHVMWSEMSDVAALGPWQGWAVLAAWVAVLLTVAAVLLRRRDA
ncbi:ABC transporter permease [Actinotalea sp. JY-7876]|uniref:ABC transporter permease n=1 Tax=Actinotalea sp. JY-7876 TaxID=2758442 RepID=UPI002103F29F|nr:ABC transporter permease [Actinotalea sp. JY-7876]